MVLFGQGDTAVRALSACFGIASVYLVYRIGKEFYHKNVGILAGFLLAINAFAISYSQEARQYSLLLFLTLISFFYFLRIVEAEKINKTHVILYVLVNILLCYTHLFGLFSIMAQVFYFLLFRCRHLRATFVFFGAQIITLLAFSPWIFVLIRYTFQEAVHGLDWIPEPTVTGVAEIVGSLSGAGYLWRPAGILFVLIIFFLCLSGVFLARESMRKSVQGGGVFNRKLAVSVKSLIEPKIALLLIWFLFPLVLSLVLSLTVRPIILSRCLIGITPALFLLTAIGICNIDSILKGRLSRVPASVVIALIIAVITIPGLYAYYALPQKTQWREVANMIKQDAGPYDGVIVYDEQESPFYYYYLGSSAISIEEHKFTWIEDSLIDKDRVWVVFSSGNQDDDINLRNDIFNRYGRDSLLLQEELHEITVYLFDQ